jgi:hypothetical protein
MREIPSMFLERCGIRTNRTIQPGRRLIYSQLPPQTPSQDLSTNPDAKLLPTKRFSCPFCSAASLEADPYLGFRTESAGPVVT